MQNDTILEECVDSLDVEQDFKCHLAFLPSCRSPTNTVIGPNSTDVFSRLLKFSTVNRCNMVILD